MNFKRILATMVEYRLLLVLAIIQVLKMLWDLKFYNGSHWKDPKMCNILKTDDCRAKGMGIWGSWF